MRDHEDGASSRMGSNRRIQFEETKLTGRWEATEASTLGENVTTAYEPRVCDTRRSEVDFAVLAVDVA